MKPSGSLCRAMAVAVCMPRVRKALEGTWWWWRGGSRGWRLVEAEERMEGLGWCWWRDWEVERRGVCSVVGSGPAIVVGVLGRWALDDDMLLSLLAWTVWKQSPHGRP